MTKITATISKGNVTLTVNGVKGSACHQVTNDLETKLGTVTNSTATAEAYERPNVSVLHQ